MGVGHFGNHKVGGPYSVTETFIIPCEDKCDFMENSNDEGDIWNECINCGEKIDIDMGERAREQGVVKGTCDTAQEVSLRLLPLRAKIKETKMCTQDQLIISGILYELEKVIDYVIDTQKECE